MRKTRFAEAERWLLLVPIATAGLMVVGGFALAFWMHEPEWVKRSGSAVVAVESLIAVLENRRRHRFERIPTVLRQANEFIQEEIERAESRLLWLAIGLAVAGELLHGFGDLIFELLFAY